MSKQAKIYLASTFLITWGLWWLLSFLSLNGFIQFGQIPFWILYIIGGNGPLIAAIFTRKVFGQKDEYKDFIKQIFKVNINALWYFGIIVVLILDDLLIWLIHSVSKGFSEPLFSQPLYMIVLLLPVMVIGGGLEEVGWRGVLLPELTKKLSNTLSTIIISVIWSLWHLPLWFIKGVPQENISFLKFSISVLALSLLLTVVYNGTKSIFMCIFFHSLTNSYSTVLNSISINTIIDKLIQLSICVLVFIVYNNITSRRVLEGSSVRRVL